MTKNYEKLRSKLQELFQLDQPDLDFGLYRVMHAKSAEVSQFLDKDLLPQVQAAFGHYKTADKADIEKDLAMAIQQAKALGVPDPEAMPKVKELRTRLANDAVDVAALESEVYDHLFSFFRRYYSDGDFLAKRVYKPGVYAIPYEGEEVTLYWANKDQYYIKTSEYLRDYAFRLRSDDDKKPMRVHFRLVDAAEGEHGNVKAAEGKERRFSLADENPVSIDLGELVVRFTYQPDASKQKELNAAAENAILASSDTAMTAWIAELGKPHMRSDGTSSGTRLRVHLDRYAARNAFDYFIHKDLGGFLRRELDFYIKNEVMHLDDVENETAPRVEQYLSKIKVIRKIAGKIVDFLAQLEDFQKKLWLKKKFVVETQWCITLDRIPEEFYAEIAGNDAQREQWVKLFGIDEMKGDLATPGYSAPVTIGFLKANPYLLIDTALFPSEFVSRIVQTFANLDESTMGLLIHGENFQASTLISARYQHRIDVVFADPPYNTGVDGFPYKDSYQHSTWLTMLENRLAVIRPMMARVGLLFLTIDFIEVSKLRLLCDEVFGPENFLADIAWEKRYTRSNNAKRFYSLKDTVLSYRSSEDVDFIREDRTEKSKGHYTNPDDDPRGPWISSSYVNPASKAQRPNLVYPIRNPITELDVKHQTHAWKYDIDAHRRHISEKRLYWGADGGYEFPRLKSFLSEATEGMVPIDVWHYKDTGTTDDGGKVLKGLFGGEVFDNPKPPSLVRRAITLSPTDSESLLVLDHFAGSGTTGHAVIDLNRADDGKRKYVLVEAGAHFDSVLRPRLKKVVYSEEWESGKPTTRIGLSHAFKYVRLESYEDALTNLETRRTDTQQLLLDAGDTQGADGLKEQYLLRYMLDVETRGSQSLLNVQAFTDPTAYKLKVKPPGSDESREVNVDLLETFNWLIGLIVQHIAAPQIFSAAFERDSEKRLRLKSRLKQEDTSSNGDAPYWFRTVTGTTLDGRRTLIIWRKLPGEPEQDNLVLDEWFAKQGYSAKDSEFDLIYVNGGNNLENLKTPDDTWKVRLIEEDFHRLMFEAEGV